MALDPARGFVALPLDVLEIEMSPGAFRTLVEFCRMANSDGVCWPSLDQLGRPPGPLPRRRSAATSPSCATLGLIETETQRTANGFNYRLRYPRDLLAALEGALPPPGPRPLNAAFSLPNALIKKTISMKTNPPPAPRAGRR